MNALLPATMGRLVASIADVLEAHTRALIAGDAAAATEHAAYAELVDRHRRIASELTSLAQRMEHYRDLPIAKHDSAIMSAPSVIGAFEVSVKIERGLAELLHERIEQHQQMLVEWLASVAVDKETM